MQITVRKFTSKITALAVLGFMSILFAACSTEPQQTGAEEPIPTLTDLGSLEELRERFNQDAGIPRLFLLVAPT